MATIKSINDFVSSVGDLQRSNIYAISIIIPPLLKGKSWESLIENKQYLTLLCKVGETPATSINTVEISKYNRSYMHAVGHKYDDITLTFLLDQGGLILNFLEDWMHLISNRKTYTVQYKKNYVTQMGIELFDRSLKKAPNVVYDIYNAFPVSKGKVNLTAGDGGLAEINVTFNYETFNMKSTGANYSQPYHSDTMMQKASDFPALFGSIGDLLPEGLASAGTILGQAEDLVRTGVSAVGTATGLIGEATRVANAVAGVIPGTKLAEQIHAKVTQVGTTTGRINSEVGGVVSRAGNAVGSVELAGQVAKGVVKAGSAVKSILGD